jgi:spore germination cell wall hydrolase CwlJ-like protein
MSQSGIALLIAVLAANAHQANNEKLCLAQALYYEARGEGERGQQAVAEVILHRVHSGAHPNTICGVVYEPYQFSFAYDGSMRRKLEPQAWEASNQLAARLFREETGTAITKRTMFYHKADIKPDWTKNLVRTAQIGNHIFYEPKKETHRPLRQINGSLSPQG